MIYDIPREVRVALGIGLIVFVATILFGLTFWCVIKHMIIHRRKRICKHEQSCTLCDKGYCIKCDGHKETIRHEVQRSETPCRIVNDKCTIIYNKNKEAK